MSDESVPQNRGFAALKDHVSNNRLDTALWASRVLTIVFAIGYVFPIFGSATTAYNKVLLANAATSAFRLHQRLPPIRFTREFLSLLLM